MILQRQRESCEVKKLENFCEFNSKRNLYDIY